MLKFPRSDACPGMNVCQRSLRSSLQHKHLNNTVFNYTSTSTTTGTHQYFHQVPRLLLTVMNIKMNQGQTVNKIVEKYE